MRTRSLPGRVIRDVTLVPFWPIGSRETCTMSLLPFLEDPFYPLVRLDGGCHLFELFIHHAVDDDVSHVEKGRLFKSDIDEGGIHPRQYSHDLPFVDVADDALVVLSSL